MSNALFTVDDFFSKGNQIAVTGRVSQDVISLNQELTLSSSEGEKLVTVTMIEKFAQPDMPQATPEDGEVALTLSGVVRGEVKAGDKLLASV